MFHKIGVLKDSLFKGSWKPLQLYYKRDSNTGVFLWISQSFKENLLYRTYSDGRSWKKKCNDINIIWHWYSRIWYLKRKVMMQIRFDIVVSEPFYLAPKIDKHTFMIRKRLLLLLLLWQIRKLNTSTWP